MLGEALSGGWVVKKSWKYCEEEYLTYTDG
jgi:hypothetical protein